MKFQIEKREKDLDTNEEKILREKIHIDNNLSFTEQLNQIYNQLDIISNQLNINDIISVFFKKGPERKLINFDSIEERIVKKLPLLGNQITLVFTTALKSIFPSVLDKSGQRHVVQLKGQLRKTNKDFQIKIIGEREDDIESVKKIFDENLNFSEYISSVIKINSEYNFKDNRVNVTLELIIQLYTNDDYYDTIGRYKAAYQSICVRGLGSKTKELKKLAEELSVDIEHESRDNLCELIKKRIETLTWENFSIEK